ncbi:hypothetical protein FRB96_003580 [Tulasnella sp. 330]|nr:hypothetical protein FRB96_003580 [Tulasnella sp. 330]KAG8886242.1 hypothetical protein FRB97_006245 [Tulasnella sp. 331]KAG8888359.1 hypothetical protein FRB98_007934 [Tulasnella sp. 332]
MAHVLTTLVRLSERDRPFGILAEVLQTISQMVVQMDERFLVHTNVHKAVIRLLRTCVGDEIPDSPVAAKSLGAAGSSSRISPSEYEEDRVYSKPAGTLRHALTSRIRTYPDLLMIFFHIQNWFNPRSPLDDLDELDDEEEDEEEEQAEQEDQEISASNTGSGLVFDADTGEAQRHSETGDKSEVLFDLSATPTKHSVLLEQAQLREETPLPLPDRASTSPPPERSKPQYEFLIFNYLMRFIHREGSIGEFGRAGLLFLLDIAMASEEMRSESDRAVDDPVVDAASALCYYLLESDFAEVMSAGLGAVYSLLPYKLEVKQDAPPSGPSSNPGGGGMTLGVVTTGTVDEERNKAEIERSRVERLGTEVSTSAEFRSRLDHFLKLVEFVQDVLRRVQIGSIVTHTGPTDTTSSLAPSRLSAGHGPTTSLCRAITLSILDSVRSIFLQNVLYPSILECSDADRSAVAVMSYITILLQTIRSGPLCDVLIDFLMTDEDDDFTASRRNMSRAPLSSFPTAKATKRLRRRSSAMVLLSMEAPNSTEPSGYFNSLGRFTLKDLLITNLDRSSTMKPTAQQTGVAALTLLHTLMTEYCEQSTEGLFSVVRDPDATGFPAPRMILGALEIGNQDDESDDGSDDRFQHPGADSATPTRRVVLPRPSRVAELFPAPTTSATTRRNECSLYRDLVSRINSPQSQDPFSTTYDRYLEDAIDLLQSQCCYNAAVNFPSTGHSLSDHQHHLRPADPMVKALVDSLRRFFTHSPEFNVALTGVITDVSACPHRSMASWLTLAPKDDDDGMTAWSKQDQGAAGGGVDETTDDDDEWSIDYATDQKLQSEGRTLAFEVRLKDPRAMPILYTVLSGLVTQLDHFRMFVDDFDGLLSERRKGLLFTEHLNDALSLALESSPDSGDTMIGAGNAAKTPQVETTSPPRPTAPPSTPEFSAASSKAAAATRPKAKNVKTSFLTSFLNPKKTTAGPADGDPTTPVKQTAKALPASPFAPHYLKTSSVEVQVLPAPLPTSGPWAPTPRRYDSPNVTAGTALGGFEDHDVFTARHTRAEPLRGKGRSPEDGDLIDESRKVSLSQLLDNVVILEEAIKELSAIVQVRAGMGIDSVKYV